MKRNLYKLSFVIILSLMISCKENTESDIKSTQVNYLTDTETGIKTGGIKIIPISTPKGIFKVWTKRIGNNPQIKLLLLNGGPGLTHEYLECFESFLPAEGIEIIYYDQLECGNSDHPNDSSLWDLPRYVEEVEQIRKALNLSNENFFLLGHSWGGILAMEYALKYQSNMKGLIISSMMCSAPEYGKYANEVLSKQMELVVLNEIRLIEKRKDFSNPRYMELLNEHYYTAHILRLPVKEWPEPVTRSFSKINYPLYVNMQGPSEFGISGKLENWDISNQLKNIAIPTLVVGAKHDTMDPEYMKWMSETLPNGKFLFCPDGSHMCMYDDQEIYMNGVISFLKKSN